MGTDGDMCAHPNQELLVPSHWNTLCRRGDTSRNGTHYAGMGSAKSNKSDWNSKVVARLRDLLENIRWDEKTLAEEIHQELGIGKKAVEKYFTDNSIPAYSIYFIARHFGISTEYLMLATNDLKRAINKRGLYARESEREAKVRAALGAQQTIPRKAAR
ncbi:MAG: hypothetical protein ACR2RF_06095 [Geminicoccaceae bacterium]